MSDLNEQMREEYNGHYFSLQATGVAEVDAILAAIADAAHCYHHTADWTNDEENGCSAVQRIQRATQEAANAWNRRTPASPAVQPVGDELDEGAAIRLRLVCEKLGLGNALPANPRELWAVAFSALGMVRHEIENLQRAALSPATVQAAPVESYSDADQAFHAFWYGHMLDDLMQPPLVDIDYTTARYIWDRAAPALHAAAGADAKDAALSDEDAALMREASSMLHDSMFQFCDTSDKAAALSRRIDARLKRDN